MIAVQQAQIGREAEAILLYILGSTDLLEGDGREGQL